MTPKEFKAWFEGFTEAMDGEPTPSQWTKIKERVAQIDGAPVTREVFIDRYWPSPRRWYGDTAPWWYGRVWETLAVKCAAGGQGGMLVNNAPNAVTVGGKGFDTMAAMHALGDADFKDAA
jgi:hypothetical protein